MSGSKTLIDESRATSNLEEDAILEEVSMNDPIFSGEVDINDDDPYNIIEKELSK